MACLGELASRVRVCCSSKLLMTEGRAVILAVCVALCSGCGKGVTGKAGKDLPSTGVSTLGAH